MRLLLAEDERALSKALVAILKHNNYSVDAVYDGEEALDYLASGIYDALILDVMMPGMDGYALTEVLPEDFNGDKEKRVSLAMLMIYTEEQMKEIEANRKDVKIDRQSNRRELEKFQSMVINGEYAVCLLDPSLFDMVKDAEGFVKLSEVLGYSPRGAVNDYAVRLSDLPFGQFFSGIKDLPRDTYLCLRTPGAVQSVSGAGKGSDKFEQAVRMVKAIIEFEFPDNYAPDAK